MLSKQNWGIYEDKWGRKRFARSTATNFDIELQLTEILSHHFSFFFLDIGLQRTKNNRLVAYIPRKEFNSFVQSVVDARRAGDKIPLSGVVAETMNFLGNSSYGYQILERSKHTSTKYLGDEKKTQSYQ